ncbi:MAG: glycosyltransferase [Woeseiaceae bacterium]
MKILFVTRDKFPPFRPAAAAIFKEELPSRGHQIDWVLQAAKPQPSVIQPYGSGTAYIGANSGGRAALRRVLAHCQDLLNYFRVFRLLKKNRYDIVQVKDHYLPGLIALLACKLHRVPFCYWLAYPHAEDTLYKAREGITRYRWYYRFRGTLWKWLLYKILLPSSVHVFVQSEQMKRDVALEGVPLEKMTAVPGSLDLDEIPYRRRPTSCAGAEAMGDHAVLYLGLLSRVRYMDFLLRVFEKVAKINRKSMLYMLGKGDEPEDEVFLRDEAHRLGTADRVVFTGYLPMELAWEYVRRAAVCVSPYYPMMILNSTSPTKLIEYMAMARPTVGNDHPEQRLVLEASGAGICVPYDEAAFADAIVTLLEDPATAREMGLKGRAYVEKYRTNVVMADVVEDQYRRICEPRLEGDEHTGSVP